MVDLSERENGLWGREWGDRANKEFGKFRGFRECQGETDTPLSKNNYYRTKTEARKKILLTKSFFR